MIGQTEQLVHSKSQKGLPLTDEQVVKIIRSNINSNLETIAMCQSTKGVILPGVVAGLEAENTVLEDFMPKYWSETTIGVFLANKPIWHEMIDAQTDGQATGLVMKELKKEGAIVEGRTVAAAVMKIRHRGD